MRKVTTFNCEVGVVRDAVMLLYFKTVYNMVH
jgi:hypothetical protein